MGADNATVETLTSHHTWVPGKLFSFATTRPADFTFTAGQFARLGLARPTADGGTEMVWRAYSIASSPLAPELEFFSIVVPEGPFTTGLVELGVGDTIHVDPVAYGFLTTDRFAPGEDLWLISSGTGLAPFLSILQDHAIWQQYQRVVVVHSVREVEELAYRIDIEHFATHPNFAPYFAQQPDRLRYVPVVTRAQDGDMLNARVQTLLEDGRLEARAGLTLDPARSRVMLCGNPDMLKTLRAQLGERGFKPSRRGEAGNLAVENYW
jgi:ferredoxin--NADP+ reductase